MADAATEAPAAVAAYQEASRPRKTAATPKIAGQRHAGRDAGGPVPCGDGRCEQQADDEQRADGLVRRDDGQGHESDERGLCDLRTQPQHRGDPRIERQGHERTVERGGGDQSDGRGGGEQHEIRPADREDVAEQDRGRVGGEAAGVRDDDDAQRQHRDEQQADARVVRQARSPLERADAEAHRDGAQRPADQHGQREHRGDGDAGEHAVCERLAEERHPADDHPGADDRAEDRDQGAAEHPALQEVEGEGGEDTGRVSGHDE